MRQVCAWLGLLALLCVAGCNTYSPPPPALVNAPFPPPPSLPQPTYSSEGLGSIYGGGGLTSAAILSSQGYRAAAASQTISHSVPALHPLRSSVVGSCDCPYDFTSSGAICGGNSAYSRPGGNSPACYGTSATAHAVNRPSYQSPTLPTYNSAFRLCAENGSCYGDTSAATGRPKTVSVGGYFRKDGTYVRGHYRSAPRRKKW